MLSRPSATTPANRPAKVRKALSNTRRDSHQNHSYPDEDEEVESDPSFSSDLVQTSTPHKSATRSSYNSIRTSFADVNAIEDDEDRDLRASDTESLDGYELEKGVNDSVSKYSLLHPRHLSSPISRTGSRYKPTPSSGSSTMVDPEPIHYRQIPGQPIHEGNAKSREDRVEQLTYSSQKVRRHTSVGSRASEADSGSSSSPPSRLPSARSKRTPHELLAYVEAKTMEATSTVPFSTPPIRKTVDKLVSTPNAPGAYPLTGRKVVPSLLSRKQPSSIVGSNSPSNNSGLTSAIMPHTTPSQAIHSAFSEYITGPQGALTQSAERRAAMALNVGRARQTPSPKPSIPAENSKLDSLTPHPVGYYPFTQAVATKSVDTAGFKAEGSRLSTPSRVPGNRGKENSSPKRKVQEAIHRGTETLQTHAEPKNLIADTSLSGKAYEGDREESFATEDDVEDDDEEEEEQTAYDEISSGSRGVAQRSAVRFAMEDSIPGASQHWLSQSAGPSANRVSDVDKAILASRPRSRSTTPPLPPPLPSDAQARSPELLPVDTSVRRRSQLLDPAQNERRSSLPKSWDSPTKKFPFSTTSKSESAVLLNGEQSGRDFNSNLPKTALKENFMAMENEYKQGIKKDSEAEPSMLNLSVYDGSTLQDIASELLKVVQSMKGDSIVQGTTAAGEAVQNARFSKPGAKALKEQLETESEGRRKLHLFNEELSMLEQKSLAEKVKRESIMNQLAIEQREEKSLIAQLANLQQSIEQMGTTVSDQVSSVVQETIKDESLRRARWICLLLFVQMIVLLAMFRYANMRANRLFQNMYYDPFYPISFPPQFGLRDNVLRETLTLFPPSPTLKNGASKPLYTYVPGLAHLFKLDGTRSESTWAAAETIMRIWKSWHRPSSTLEAVKLWVPS